MTSGGSAGAVSVGDFNGDDLADLVVANTGGGYFHLVGEGDGVFAPRQVEPTGLDASTVETGDFDRDGFSDVLAASYATDRSRCSWVTPMVRSPISVLTDWAADPPRSSPSRISTGTATTTSQHHSTWGGVHTNEHQ